MSKFLEASVFVCVLNVSACFALPLHHSVEFPGIKQESSTTEPKLTKEEELKPWFADCTRRIRRKWQEEQTLKNVDCTFRLSSDGDVHKLKLLKGTEQSPLVEAILLKASKFRKAPNDLPYRKTLHLKFKEFPDLEFRLKSKLGTQ